MYMEYIAAALTIVAGMAWNDAVKSALETYIQKDESIAGKFIYALIITSIGAITIYMMKTLSTKVATIVPAKAAEMLGTEHIPKVSFNIVKNNKN